MNRDTQSRKWQITINNPSEHGVTHEGIKTVLKGMSGLEYWCMCDEIGKEGTYHIHLFLMGQNGYRFSAMKKRFPGAHIEMAKGTAQENRAYIRKEGKWERHKKKETNLGETFEEEGECPIEEPGRRNDLDNLYDMIKEGKTDSEILEANPAYMMCMDRVERARQIVLEAKYKKEWRLMHNEYHYGHTGMGKTRGVMEEYGYENVYRVTDYSHPFDGYEQQPVMVFEEFRSSLPIQSMLNYMDGYPVKLPCRYHNKQACYEKVRILSNIPLEEQYPQIQKDHPEVWEAFKRRIHAVKYYPKKVVFMGPREKVVEYGDCPF